MLHKGKHSYGLSSDAARSMLSTPSHVHNLWQVHKPGTRLQAANHRLTLPRRVSGPMSSPLLCAACLPIDQLCHKNT